MRYLPARVGIYCTSYIWPLWIVLNLLVGLAAIQFTDGIDWAAGDASDSTADFVTAIFWMWGIVVGVGGGFFTAFHSLEMAPRFHRARIRNYSDSKEPQQSIVAEPHKNLVKVYLVESTIAGTTKSFLNEFHAEDDLDECLEFTSKKKKELENENVDQRPAKQLARTINKG
jgi:hypothetical protein